MIWSGVWYCHCIAFISFIGDVLFQHYIAHTCGGGHVASYLYSLFKWIERMLNLEEERKHCLFAVQKSTLHV